MGNIGNDEALRNLRGPTQAEADAVAALIGHPPENAPKPRRSTYTGIDLHHRNDVWPSPLPALSPREATRAAKRLWRFAVGKAWGGRWAEGGRYRYAGPVGNVFHVNPAQGWDRMVHSLSHRAYHALTHGSRHCSPRKLADYQHVKRRDSAGRTIHHSSAHANLERELIAYVIRNNWLSGTLKPAR